MTAKLQSSQCENKPTVNVKKVAVDIKKKKTTKKHDGVINVKRPLDGHNARRPNDTFNPFFIRETIEAKDFLSNRFCSFSPVLQALNHRWFQCNASPRRIG